jgi:hypothetical protein
MRGLSQIVEAHRSDAVIGQEPSSDPPHKQRVTGATSSSSKR